MYRIDMVLMQLLKTFPKEIKEMKQLVIDLKSVTRRKIQEYEKVKRINFKLDYILNRATENNKISGRGDRELSKPVLEKDMI